MFVSFECLSLSALSFRFSKPKGPGVPDRGDGKKVAQNDEVMMR